MSGRMRIVPAKVYLPPDMGLTLFATDRFIMTSQIQIQQLAPEFLVFNLPEPVTINLDLQAQQQILLFGVMARVAWVELQMPQTLPTTLLMAILIKVGHLWATV